MQTNAMEKWQQSSHFAGANADYLEEMYEQYLNEPQSVSPQWQQLFSQLPSVVDSNIDGSTEHYFKRPNQEQSHLPIREHFRRLAREKKVSEVIPTLAEQEKQSRVLQLINSFRVRGHQQARLDPLGLMQRDKVLDLALEFHQLTDKDLTITFGVGSYGYGASHMTLQEIVASLHQIYCRHIGAEFMHVTDPIAREWLLSRFEQKDRINFNLEEKTKFLAELTAAEGLERYLAAKFPGAKRFSLEGGDVLVPAIKEIIRHSGAHGMQEVVIGMAHRGRLNMLVNVFGKKPQDLFDEFAGKHYDKSNSWGTGDVKYHQGFSSDFATDKNNVHLVLAFNPSHLEIVSPVVIGSVRARQERLKDKSGDLVLPITIHGDSAIAGQGIVAETFNMSQTRGYNVGGTIRIVINNQVGFTTSNPKDTRSTEYCTDIAKMVQAPIFHVNGDDPEAVAYVSRLALDFRNQFKRDVVIDIVCYRRQGHNEADEPNATQPLMYQQIKKHPTPRKLYALYLEDRGQMTVEHEAELVNDYRDMLDHGECVVSEWRPMDPYSVNWSDYLNHEWNEPWQSQVDPERLIKLGHRICSYPDSHELQGRVAKIYQDRLTMLSGEKPLDWGLAELLAYATLVDDGYQVRLTGQDSGRGTFFHRHAVLHNQINGSIYTPLSHIQENQAPFTVIDSVLSEASVLAFEYGYATAEPNGLTIWEAQFGDFANGAQVVIDQFISSGEQKWGRLCGLTMLLPHGYEGQGPEHSSARLERYLQLCAQHNMQIVVPSTPAQVYHMLRRQVIRKMRRPLVVMSPKSLLRHPLCVSSLEDLYSGRFQNAIGEIDSFDSKKVKRIVLCAGKVYYDLLEQRRKNEQEDVALIRIEQLYPFPFEELTKILEVYPQVTDYVWCQEEPQNQGAWYSSRHNFSFAIPVGATLNYAGREASASPAAGYMSLHTEQQQAFINDALTITDTFNQNK